MANGSDVNTKVRVTGDPSGLNNLGRAAREAFHPRTVRQFQRAAKDVDSELKRVVATQVRLIRDMRGVERGTSQYKRLAGQLEDVNDEAKKLRSVLNDINSITSRPRRQGFAAGLGQGTGLAQYIPTGPGMGARMAGAGIGRMGRRAVGGIAAPFQSPGVGGFAGLLQAIPFVGQAAGAALMAGHGYFQQAIGFDRARIENTQYLPNLEDRAAQYQQQLARRAAVRRRGEDLKAAFLRNKATIAAAERTLRGEMFDPLQRGPGEATGIAGRTNRRLDQLNMVRDTATAASKALQETVGGKFLSLIPEVRDIRTRMGGIAGATTGRNREAIVQSVMTNAARDLIADTIDKSTKNRLQQIQAQFGGQGILSPGYGAMFGFSPTATQGMMGEFMGARGGTFGKTAGAEFFESLALRRRFGVESGTAGAYARMAMPGAGGGGNVPMLSKTISAALALGLRGSQINEHLQTLVQQGKQMETMGVKFDVRHMTGSAMTLRALGLQGMQSTRVMGQMQTAARGVSAKGVQGPMDLLLARAAGYTPEGGAESYAGAMNRLAGGLSPEMMTGLLGQVTQGAKGGDWGPQMQRLLVRRALGSMGVQVGPEQAQMLLQGFQGGQMTEGARSVLAGLQQEGGRYGAGDFAKSARVGARMTGGLAVYAAGAEAQQIGAGKQLAGVYINLENIGRQSVSTLAGFSGALKKATASILSVMKDIDKLSKNLGPILPGQGR